MTITHEELRGWITALSAGKKIASADQLRLANELLNTRAELWQKNVDLVKALWNEEEQRDASRFMLVAHRKDGERWIAGRNYEGRAEAEEALGYWASYYYKGAVRLTIEEDDERLAGQTQGCASGDCVVAVGGAGPEGGAGE